MCAVPARQQAVFQEVARTVAEIKNLPVDELLAAEAAHQPLVLDSLDLVELSIRLERSYGFEIGADPEDFVLLRDLHSLAELVTRRSRA